MKAGGEERAEKELHADFQAIEMGLLKFSILFKNTLFTPVSKTMEIISEEYYYFKYQSKNLEVEEACMQLQHTVKALSSHQQSRTDSQADPFYSLSSLPMQRNAVGIYFIPA